MTPAVLLSAILALPLYKLDRAPELATEKRQQLEMVASAIHDAAEATRWPGPKSELRALLVTVGYHESGFALHIGRGDCRQWECDRDRNGNVRAAGYWQQWQVGASSAEAWEAARTDVKVAAREAARALARSRWLCRSLEDKRDWVAMTLSAFAGRHCVGSFKGLSERVAAYRRMVAR